MAGFNLNDVLGAVLGGNQQPAARRGARGLPAPRRGTSQNAMLGRALTVLVGAAADAISKMGQSAPQPQAPMPMPVPRPTRMPGPDVPAATPGYGKPVPQPGPWWSGPAQGAEPVPPQKPGIPPKPGMAPKAGSVPATGPMPAPAPGPWSTPAPPPPAPSAPSSEHAEALLLIRTMIAAAKADGTIDPDERAGISRQLDTAGLTPAERDFVLADLGRTTAPETLAAEARDPMLAAQLYAAAFAATRAVSAAERAWLDAFARALRLDRAAVEAIEKRLGGQPPA